MIGREFATLKGMSLDDIKTNRSSSDLILKQIMEFARVSALSEMASGVAHELNQPLGAIATFAQAGERMLNRPDPMVPRALDVFRQINQAALAAGAGIQRIRGLFECEMPTRTRCQLPELIAELHPILEFLAMSGKGTLQRGGSRSAT